MYDMSVYHHLTPLLDHMTSLEEAVEILPSPHQVMLHILITEIKQIDEHTQRRDASDSASNGGLMHVNGHFKGPSGCSTSSPSRGVSVWALKECIFRKRAEMHPDVKIRIPREDPLQTILAG